MKKQRLNIGGLTVYLREDGLYEDAEGTIMSLPNGKSRDPDPKCGVDLHLPGDCRGHDHQYESDAYQKFHTRSEADADLYRCLRTQGFSKLRAGAYWLGARMFGRAFWENKTTKDK